MGAIVDILFLSQDGIKTLKCRFPRCILTDLTSSEHITQMYRIIIPGVDIDDDYYGFLVDNLLAMSSTNFKSRLDSDSRFRTRMIKRAAAVMKSQS